MAVKGNLHAVAARREQASLEEAGMEASSATALDLEAFRATARAILVARAYVAKLEEVLSQAATMQLAGAERARRTYSGLVNLTGRISRLNDAA